MVQRIIKIGRKRKMNKPTLIVSLLIVAATLILMGTTYAYFTAIATSNEQVVESGTLQLTYLTGKDISLDNVFPSEESEAGVHQFTVENTGSLDATYYLYLTNITLQKDGEDTQSSNLKWKLYSANESYGTSEEIASGDFGERNNTIELDTDVEITSGTKQYYVLKVWLQETGSVQNWDQGLDFSAQVEATTEKKNITKTLVGTMKEEAVMDNIASTYVTSSTGIDFSQISSDTNGKGLYILNSTVNDQYPIMYYRGAVENNNVKFANFCWKIVRTTETGGVKLIYNGQPDNNGQCTNKTGASTMLPISNQAFNDQNNDNTYVGYMYGSSNSNSYEDTHQNTNNSNIKTVIDEWYSQNLVTATNKLEDTVWCNDRSIAQDDDYPGTGIGTEITAYSAMYRLSINSSPSLNCINENDRFTVSEKNGNGDLTYPIALLTADEIAYAGAVYKNNNTSYYLYNNDNFWTLSPNSFVGNRTNAFDVNANGSFNGNTVINPYGVRPAISLKAGTTAISGDGTAANPYVIE